MDKEGLKRRRRCLNKEGFLIRKMSRKGEGVWIKSRCLDNEDVHVFGYRARVCG